MAESETGRPGRNEPCHCGSGKKYKHCCLPKDEEADRAARAEQAAATPSAPSGHEGHAHTPPPPRATSQPWKRSAPGPRSSRRINTPRKAG